MIEPPIKYGIKKAANNSVCSLECLFSTKSKGQICIFSQQICPINLCYCDQKVFWEVVKKICSLFVGSILGVALRLCYCDQKDFWENRHKITLPVYWERISCPSHGLSIRDGKDIFSFSAERFELSKIKVNPMKLRK